MKNIFPRAHDHKSCQTSALHAAETLAEKRGVRLTPLRRHVLEIVLKSHRPVGAYDVLKELSSARPQPPTVYRALDFLLAQGFVHRIDSLNAYIGCFSPAEPHRSHFLLCERCGRAAEINDDALTRALGHAAHAAGFAVQRETVEISGLCLDCASSIPAPKPC